MPPERVRKYTGKPKESKSPEPKKSPPIYKDMFESGDNPILNVYSCPSFTIPKVKGKRKSGDDFEKKSILAPPCVETNGPHFDRMRDGRLPVDNKKSPSDKDSHKTAPANAVSSHSKSRRNRRHRHRSSSRSETKNSSKNSTYSSDSIGPDLHFREASDPELETAETASGSDTEGRKWNGEEIVDDDDDDVLIIGLTWEEMNEFS